MGWQATIVSTQTGVRVNREGASAWKSEGDKRGCHGLRGRGVLILPLSPLAPHCGLRIPVLTQLSSSYFHSYFYFFIIIYLKFIELIHNYKTINHLINIVYLKLKKTPTYIINSLLSYIYYLNFIKKN